VLSLANNHAADYGAVGLRDTLAAVATSPVPVVGIGRNEDEAFRPHRTRVGGTTVTVFGVHQVRGYTTWNWSAGPDTPGVAASIRPKRRLLEAVRRADRAGELVVVYLHWGEELITCPTPLQRDMAVALAQAGADVVAGSHAHVLLGAGWLGDTYVSYGLANFVWYNTYRPHSGVLTLRVRDGEVVRDSFLPALIRDDGLPHPVAGPARAQAVRDWEALRGCAGLAATPPPPPTPPPTPPAS
jgi:poly-gamma-glutamate synthesis protein (capsule biosynthesis protein)